MANLSFYKFFLLLMPLYLALFVGPAHSQALDEDEIMEDMIPFIINGEDAYPGEFPSYVGIIAQNCSRLYFCGGFLACENVIITAGHCGTMQHNYVFPYLQKENRFDSTNERDSFNHTGRFQGIALPVKESFVHPLYNLSTISYDVAVMILEDGCEVHESEYVKYSSYCEWGEPKNYSFVSIGGFGRTTPDTSVPLPTHMQKAIMQKVPIEECVEVKDSGWEDIGFPNRTDAYCVFKPRGLNDSTCSGDSGSGVYQSMNGKRTSVGVVSFGDETCGPQFGSGITNICHPELKEFIDQYVDKYCYEELDECAECPAPTNRCPLNYPKESESEPEPVTTTTLPSIR